MKYNKNNIPLQCIMTNSTNYKNKSTMKVRGVLWHSTGANNPNLKRYVQPSDNDKNYQQLMQMLGKNTNGNDWNHISMQAGVNAWIGKLADETVTTVQTLPLDVKPWGCGSGPKGSCNNGWVQFEACEDSLTNRDYFETVYREACEFTAYVCALYNIDPLGTVNYNGVTVPTILCHYDAHNLKLGSNHGDVYGWFNKYNKTMQDVRNDVAKILNNKEEEEVTQVQFNEMMNTYLQELAKEEPSDWARADLTWGQQEGLLQGDQYGNLMGKKFLTRQEAIALLHRFAEKVK